MSFFKRREVKDMVSYLKVILNPESDISLLRIINTPPRKIGAKTIEKLRKGAETCNSSIYEFLKKNINGELNSLKITTPILNFFKMIDGFRNLYGQISLLELGKTVFIESGYKEYLERDLYDGGEERIQNVEELFLMLNEEEKRGKELSEIIDEISLLTSGDESSKDAKILLMTIHTAKGLEFDNVFMVSMEDGVLPHTKSIEVEDGIGIEEERRLCYVGMTRAKKRLYLSYASKKFNYETGVNYPAKRSRFLDEIPESLLEKSGDAGFLENRNFTFGDDKIDSYKALENFFYGEGEKVNSGISKRSDKDIKGSFNSDLSKDKNTFGLKSGDRVIHPRFGKGVIWKIQELPSGKKITVLFERHGKKILMEKFARLKKI